MVYGEAAGRYVLAGMIRENEMSGDWFGCVFVISFNVSKVFGEKGFPCNQWLSFLALFFESIENALGTSTRLVSGSRQSKFEPGIRCNRRFGPPYSGNNSLLQRQVFRARPSVSQYVQT